MLDDWPLQELPTQLVITGSVNTELNLFLLEYGMFTVNSIRYSVVTGLKA